MIYVNKGDYMNKRNIIISLIINIIIVLFTVSSAIMMFTGFKFMHGIDILSVSHIEMFKFYTVDSNLLMGLVSLLFLIDEIKLLKGKIKEISTFKYILKLTSTVGVTLTFLTVFLYLGNIVDGGVVILLKNSNLFLHLLIPILSIISFIFFERTNKIKVKYVFLSIIPTIIYSLIYTINVLIHIENSKVSPVYDWYYFLQNSMNNIFIVMPFMLICTYVIGLLLYILNKKHNIKNYINLYIKSCLFFLFLINLI